MAKWTPRDLASPPKAWFAANTHSPFLSDGDLVSTWTDLTPNKKDVTNSGSARPVYKNAIQNGLPVIRFDGYEDVLIGSALSNYFTASTGQSIAICKFTSNTDSGVGYSNDAVHSDTGGYHALYGRAGSTNTVGAYNWDTNADTVETAMTPGTWAILSWQHASGNVGIRRDGGTLSESASGDTGVITSTLRIGQGYAGSLYSELDLGEILFFDTILSASDREKIEGYLAHKWGLTSVLSGGHPYKTDAPTTATNYQEDYWRCGLPLVRSSATGDSTIWFKGLPVPITESGGAPPPVVVQQKLMMMGMGT